VSKTRKTPDQDQQEKQGGSVTRSDAILGSDSFIRTCVEENSLRARVDKNLRSWDVQVCEKERLKLIVVSGAKKDAFVVLRIHGTAHLRHSSFASIL
jgi:hypothetical protein